MLYSLQQWRREENTIECQQRPLKRKINQENRCKILNASPPIQIFCEKEIITRLPFVHTSFNMHSYFPLVTFTKRTTRLVVNDGENEEGGKMRMRTTMMMMLMRQMSVHCGWCIMSWLLDAIKNFF